MSCQCPSTNVPGSPGGPGQDGNNGTDGINAYTTLVGGTDIIPVYGGTVSLTVADTRWMGLDQVLYIEIYGYYRVDSIASDTVVVVENLGYTGNINGDGVTTFVNGAKVSPAGLQGASGTAPATVLLKAQNLADVANTATARTNLGLGTLALQAANAVAITGGSITGITDLAVADGGTGASTAANARTNLGAAGSGLATASGLTLANTDKVLGRASAGTGPVEEITFTDVGQAVLACATLATLQAYLGVGSRTIATKIASYSATTSDDVLLCDATAGAIIIGLPAVATSSGKVLVIKKIDATANTVTIDGNLGELIDGAATQVISAQWTAIEIVCNGTAWYII